MECWHTLLCIVLFMALFGKGWTIGITTHIESGKRAQEFADVKSEGIDYGELVKTHEDAFQAGLPYVDSYWSVLCYGSTYYNVSQHSHWGPFIEAYIDYIRDTYPKPWDRWTEKLVVFLFGVMGHHATDVNWHGTDIDEGFVPTMGMVNFHGSFDDAHQDADVASDVLTTLQNDMEYVGTVTKWYVPSEDLEEIYKVMYGEELITAGVIENCTQIVFLARLGEQLLPFEALYPYYASRSPFVIDRFNDYFLGGVDDDAVWTQNLWYHTVTMLDHGTEVCDIPQNTLYITCNVTEDPDVTATAFHADFLDDVHNENYMKWLIDTADLQVDDIIVERTERGVYFSVSDELQELLRLNTEFRHLELDGTENETDLELPSFYYDTETPYSKIGETMLTGDMNNDGINDLIISAPGHGSDGNSNQGRVYILYGSETGLPAANLTLDEDADEILDGQELNGRFGSGVAVVDINADNIMDLAVSAPSVGSPDHQYKGQVYIYYGHGAGGLAPVPSVTISCTTRYCNFGWTLTSGDLNDDGFADLVIGSPFAPSGGEQRGFIGVFYADPDFHDRDITEEELDWRFNGEQEYQHFGETLVVQKTLAGETWLMVGSPSYRICAREDCDFDEEDIQAAGKFNAFRSPLGDTPDITIQGDEDLAQMASALWTGNYKEQELLVISSVTRNLPEFADTLDDHFNITRITDNSTQFGWVAMYDMNNLSEDMEPVYTFWGEKPFSRFGANVEFVDATGDGVTDAIISGHLYSERYVDQPDQGRVYIFSGDSEEYERYADEADMILSLGEIKCQFGSSIVSLQTGDGVQLFVSAQHSDHNVRIGGRIALFDLPI